MRDRPHDGHISFSQRERHRRGRRAVECQISGRWLRFGDPFDPRFGESDAVWVDILSDNYEDKGASLENPRTRKITSLMIGIEDLRAVLEQFDEERQLRSNSSG